MQKINYSIIKRGIMHNYKQSGKVENSQSYIVQLILEVRIIWILIVCAGQTCREQQNLDFVLSCRLKLEM